MASGGSSGDTSSQAVGPLMAPQYKWQKETRTGMGWDAHVAQVLTGSLLLVCSAL